MLESTKKKGQGRGQGRCQSDKEIVTDHSTVRFEPSQLKLTVRAFALLHTHPKSHNCLSEHK